jgi:dipeptidase
VPTRAWRELLDITHRRNVSKPEYGMIAQLRGWLPDPIGGVYWFYQDHTATSIHVPVYLGTQSIHDSFKTYDPDIYSEDSARWQIDLAENLLYLRWQDAIKDLQSLRDPLQERFFTAQPDIDQKALALYRQDPEQARDFLTRYTHQSMEKVVATYKKIQALLISKYTNNSSSEKSSLNCEV